MGMQGHKTKKRQAGTMAIQHNTVDALREKVNLASVQVRSDVVESHGTFCTHQNYPTTPEFRSLVEQGSRAWREISSIWCALKSDLPK